MHADDPSPRRTSFGKKQSAPQPELVRPSKSRLGPILVGAALLVTAAGLYWAYSNQVVLAAKLYPSALGQMSVPMNAMRIAPMWDTAGSYEETAPTIAWMTVAFRELCRDTGFPKLTRDDKWYKAADPNARNRYQPAVYGTIATASEVVAKVAKDPDFCNRDFHLAMYDERVWTIAELTKQGEEDRERVGRLLKSIESGRYPLPSQDRQSTNNDIEPTMDIARACETKWGSDYRMQEYCRKQHEEARGWAQSHSIDSDIAVHCTKRWPADWRMYVYCVKQQEEAKSRL